MRPGVLAIVALILGLTGTGTRAQQQFQLFASIVDGSGAPAATVPAADVRVTENGVAAKVVKVEPIDWPLKLQLLVDNGIGLGNDNILQLRNGTRGLIEVLPPNAEVTVVTTAPQPRFVVRATTDRAAQLQGIDRLSPDGGAGRFVESLAEATQRIERDKGDYFPVIVSVASTAGDNNVMERDIERVMARLEQRPTVVHVVLFSGGSRAAGGGANQTQVGMNVTQYTRGRFENINAASRLATLLPEIGAQVAKSHAPQGGRFRVTVERPNGASGDLGKLTMGIGGGLMPTSLSLDGRMP